MFLIRISLLIGILVPNISAFKDFVRGKDYIFNISWNRLSISDFTFGPFKQSFEGQMLVRKVDDNELLFKFQNISIHNMYSVENDVQDELEMPFKVEIVDGNTIKHLVTNEKYREGLIIRKYGTISNFLKDYSTFIELGQKKLVGEKVMLKMPFGMCNSTVDVLVEDTGNKIFVEANVDDCECFKDGLTNSTKNTIIIVLEPKGTHIKTLEIYAHTVVDMPYHESEETRQFRFDFKQEVDSGKEILLEDKVVCYRFS